MTYGLKMCFQEPGGLKAWLMFSRSEASGNFDDAVKQRLRDLLPHLELALQIYSRLMLKETKAAIYSRSMSQLVIGAIIVDGSGRVIDLNDAARRLMAQSASIEIRRDRLFCKTPRPWPDLPLTLGSATFLPRSSTIRSC